MARLTQQRRHQTLGSVSRNCRRSANVTAYRRASCTSHAGVCAPYSGAECPKLGVEMPVREFIDSAGVEWRAWEITPDAIAPPTRGEDYLADCYQLGWVVLETKSGDRRVRLCPIPRDWQRLSDESLE